MLVSARGHQGFRFGEFTLDVDRNALLKGGKEIPLRPKAYDVLHHLVLHAQTLVTKQQLMDAVWGDVIVTDDSLTQCLVEIRRALHDQDRQLIRTVPRRGVILELPAERLAPGDDHEKAPAWTPSATMPGIGGLRRLAVSALLVLVLLATWMHWAVQRSPPPMEPAANVAMSLPFEPIPQSVAVLAFDDLSPDGDQGWFADGVAEDVLNLLAQSPDLTVMARTSSFAFRGTQADIATIARRLNVAYVLEGSVRRDDQTVRVTAQLIDARTSAHLWSMSSDHTLSDVLKVQQDIALGVANTLHATLTDTDAPGQPPSPLTEDPEAWAHYKRGQFLYQRRAPGDLVLAGQLYQAAVDRNPQMARAWAGLAAVYLMEFYSGTRPSQILEPLVREAVENGLAANPDDPEVLIRAGRYEDAFGDRLAAENYYERAWETDPDNLLVLSVFAGRAADRKDYARAAELQGRVWALNPLSRVDADNYGEYLFRDGQYEAAERHFRTLSDLDASRRGTNLYRAGLVQILQRQPDAALTTAAGIAPGTYRWQIEAMAGHLLGQPDQVAAATRALEADDSTLAAIGMAQYAAFAGDDEAALVWLEIAGDRVDPSTPMEEGWLAVRNAAGSPFLRHLEDHAEMQRTANFHPAHVTQHATQTRSPTHDPLNLLR